MGKKKSNVIDVAFTPEEQELQSILDALLGEAINRNIISLLYVTQTEDGSYEMGWAGDVEYPGAIEALKVLVRSLRKEFAQQVKNG